MSYSDAESALGIKNFRRDLAGLVYPLSQMKPIDFNVDDKDDEKTYNDRFKQIAAALRYCFSAAGDIAIRDKRYLATFFAGYANPLTSNTYKYADKTMYKSMTNFDYNGVPITFTKPMIEYRINTFGTLDFSAVYTWVFKNGKLMDPSQYTLLNTAYGVKCFIADTLVANNDEISIVINRIYNVSKDHYTYTSTTAGSSLTLIIPVSQLGTFYHQKYLKLFIERGNDPKLSFYEIDQANCDWQIDVTGQNVKLEIRNLTSGSTGPFRVGDIFHVVNTVYFWEYHNTNLTTPATGSWTDTKQDEIELIEIYNGSKWRPVPFYFIEDFDVFFDGFLLIPGEHYTIIKGGNDFSTYKIKFLFTPAPGTKHSVHIWKNEACADDRDTIIVRSDLDSHGMVVASDYTVVPVMTNLGHPFLNNKYIGNARLEEKHRRVLHVNDVTDTTNFNYKVRLLNTIDIEQVVDFVVDNLSEFDIVGEWIGTDTLVNQIYANKYPAITVDPNNKSFEETNPTWTFYDVLTAAVEQYRVIKAFYESKLNAYTAGAGNLNTNTTSVEALGFPLSNIASEPNDITGNELLVLDSNMAQSAAMVIDSSKIYSTRTTPIN
jgi:hypothetical protein